MKGLWLWEDANFSRWRLRRSQITIVELLKEMSTCNGLCGLYPKKWMIWCKMFLAMFVDTSCVKWPEVSMQLPSTHRACKFSLPHSLTLWDSYESRRLFGNHGCYDSSYVYQGILSFEYARSTAITPKQGYQPGSSFSEALHKKGQVAISKTQQKLTHHPFNIHVQLFTKSWIYPPCSSLVHPYVLYESTCYNSGYVRSNLFQGWSACYFNSRQLFFVEKRNLLFWWFRVKAISWKTLWEWWVVMNVLLWMWMCSMMYECLINVLFVWWPDFEDVWKMFGFGLCFSASTTEWFPLHLETCSRWVHKKKVPWCIPTAWKCWEKDDESIVR